MDQGKLRKGRKNSLAKKRIQDESSDLHEIISKVEKEGNQVAKNVEKFFEKKPNTPKEPWETEGKGLGASGEKLTLEDLINLKPFQGDELGATIAFRAPEKMLRAAQRVKEASGTVYDILSDMYRDAFAIGLLVLSERREEILGLQIVISRAENHKRLKEEVTDTVLRLREALKPVSPDMKRVYFHSFMEAMARKPTWIQEAYLEEMRGDTALNALLEELVEEEPGSE